jgi:hypothetical protein
MKVLSVRKANVNDLAFLGGTRVALDVIRQMRAPLLTAFDIYKSNVAYGVEKEDEAQHNRILAWYQSLLELKEDALTQVPCEIARYVKGGM